MASKARATPSKPSEHSKNDSVEGQARVSLKRKASHLADSSTTSSGKENEPPHNIIRPLSRVTVSHKQKAKSATLKLMEELEAPAATIAEDASVSDKLSMLCDSVRRIHKCVGHTMRLAVTHEEKLKDVREQVEDTDATIDNHFSADQQDDIVEKLDPLETRIAGLETTITDEFDDLLRREQAIEQRINARFHELHDMLTERLDSMQDSIAAGGHGSVQHIHFGAQGGAIQWR